MNPKLKVLWYNFSSLSCCSCVRTLTLEVLSIPKRENGGGGGKKLEWVPLSRFVFRMILTV